MPRESCRRLPSRASSVSRRSSTTTTSECACACWHGGMRRGEEGEGSSGQGGRSPSRGCGRERKTSWPGRRWWRWCRSTQPPDARRAEPLGSHSALDVWTMMMLGALIPHPCCVSPPLAIAPLECNKFHESSILFGTALGRGGRVLTASLPCRVFFLRSLGVGLSRFSLPGRERAPRPESEHLRHLVLRRAPTRNPRPRLLE